MVKGNKDKTAESAILTMTEESSKMSAAVQREEGKQIEIHGQCYIYSVVFLADGKHIVSGDYERKIQGWHVEDGRKWGRQ